MLKIQFISETPGDISQNTDYHSSTAVIIWTPPTASDDSGVVTLTASHNPGERFPIGSTEVTYTAIDPYSNVDMTSFIVTITGMGMGRMVTL